MKRATCVSSTLRDRRLLSSISKKGVFGLLLPIYQDTCSRSSAMILHLPQYQQRLQFAVLQCSPLTMRLTLTKSTDSTRYEPKSKAAAPRNHLRPEVAPNPSLRLQTPTSDHAWRIEMRDVSVKSDRPPLWRFAASRSSC